jgi:hypothetical protein
MTIDAMLRFYLSRALVPQFLPQVKGLTCQSDKKTKKGQRQPNNKNPRLHIVSTEAAITNRSRARSLCMMDAYTVQRTAVQDKAFFGN